jgi:hypothetical protein
VDLTQLKKRKKALYQERQSWDAQYKECAKYVLPRAGRFDLTDRNLGNKRFTNIYDSTAVRANRTLAAGMMAGMTSPARPWFRLATPDTKLMENDDVKLWLDQVVKIMRMVFAKSNLYKTLHAMYEELGCFGMAAAYVCRDFDNIVHSTCLTCGEYAVAQNSKGVVDTLVREYQATVGQVVNEFGIDNCSSNVQSSYKNGNLDSWVTITHMVLPRADRDLKKPDNKNKKFASFYWESSSNDKVLRESGYDKFPYVVPRWVLSGGDVNGTGPAMECLGAIKQLQHQHLRKAQAIDYKTNPPLQMPAGYRSMEINTLPGGISYVDMSTANGGIRSAFEVQIDLRDLDMSIQDARREVEATFYADLFLMLAQDDRSGITAREISERHEEKMLMLGPVLERLHNELIEPLIDIVFDAVVEAVTDTGPLLPPAPEELQNMELSVDFISTLSQAQKQIGLGAIEKFAMFVGQMAQLKGPDALDKYDADQAMDVYGDLLGVDPALIVADDKVSAARDARAEKQAQQEQMAQMAQMAKPMDQMAGAAQKMGGTTAGEGTALNTLLEGLQGYG